MILFYIILLIIIILFLKKKKSQKRNFYINKIIIFHKNDLYTFLINNKDNFYNYFYKNDFIARNINNINEYKIKIKYSTANINDYQKKILIDCIIKTDDFFYNLKNKFINKNILNIPWKFGFIKGKKYENGLPHTRDDVIILNINNIYNEKDLIKTLIHEKVHLYQKKYKYIMNNYLKINKFTKVKKREPKDNIIANPDLDNFIYKDKNNKIYKAVYNKNPKNINDITYFPFNNEIYEHPYEKMAFDIENLYE